MEKLEGYDILLYNCSICYKDGECQQIRATSFFYDKIENSYVFILRGDDNGKITVPRENVRYMIECVLEKRKVVIEKGKCNYEGAEE